MTTTIILIVLAAVVIVIVLLPRLNRRHATAENGEDQLQDFPYAAAQFLSPAELDYFHALRQAVGGRAALCAKVRLSDLVAVTAEGNSKRQSYRNKIDQKHVDFLLCDPHTMQPLAAIELDDRSHQRHDRQARDAFVDGVFAAAGLPLLHVPQARAYVAAEIEAQVAPYLGVGAAPAPPPRAPLPRPHRWRHRYTAHRAALSVAAPWCCAWQGADPTQAANSGAVPTIHSVAA